MAALRRADFRKDYQAIGGVIRERFVGLPVTALTATATARVQADVKRSLGMTDCACFQVGARAQSSSTASVTTASVTTGAHVASCLKRQHPELACTESCPQVCCHASPGFCEHPNNTEWPPTEPCSCEHAPLQVLTPAACIFGPVGTLLLPCRCHSTGRTCASRSSSGHPTHTRRS